MGESGRYILAEGGIQESPGFYVWASVDARYLLVYYSAPHPAKENKKNRKIPVLMLFVKYVFLMIHYFLVTKNECKYKEECTMKTAAQILKFSGKVLARLVIWLAGKLEGGK